VYILAIIKTNLLYPSSQHALYWSLQNQSDHNTGHQSN